MYYRYYFFSILIMDATAVRKTYWDYKQAIQHLISNAFLVFSVILTLLSFVLFSSCVERKMSLKEAKQVTVSMSQRSFAPPPRSINDIMTVLEDAGKPDAQAITTVSLLKAHAAALPPEGASKITLVDFYIRRAHINFDLGLNMKGIQDLRKSYRLMKESGSFNSGIEGAYAMWEAWSGNINKGIEILKEHIKRPDALAQAFNNLQYAYIESGNLKAAEKVKNKGMAFIYKKKVLNRILIYSKAKLEYKSLEAQGK